MNRFGEEMPSETLPSATEGGGDVQSHSTGWWDRVLNRPDLIALAYLLFVAIALRVVNLGVFPDTVNPDEADNTEDALRIMYGMHPQNGIFGFDWTQQPAFSVYMLSSFLRSFGVNVVAVRLPSAVISTVAMIPFYLLLRRQFSAAASLFATFLLATNLWYLNFSRSGWNNVHVSLYMLGAMLFLLLGIDSARGSRGRPGRSWLWFCLAGACCALGLYGYPAGRSIVVALVVFSPLAASLWKVSWRRLVGGYLVLAIVAGVLFAPQAAYIAQNWETFNVRTRAVLVLNSPEFRQNPVGILSQQVIRNAVGFWDGRVNHTGRYTPDGEPLLDSLTGGLVLGGMVLSLALARLRRRPENWLWWIMLLVSWAMTELPTANTPDGARGVGWMPTLLYFAAVFADEFPLPGRKVAGQAGWASMGVLALLGLVIGYINVTHYWSWQGQPVVRQQRSPFVTVQEFPLWATAVIDRAKRGEGGFPVNVWRESHPLSEAAPQAASQTSPITPPKFTPPSTPQEQWLRPLRTFGGRSATEGELVAPRSVAVDKSGQAYVVDADPSVQMIKKYDASGHFVGSWGGTGEGDGKFTAAWAVVVNRAGEVLVLDEVTCWVQVFDGNGKFLRKWGGPQMQAYHPRAMGVDSSDDVYIADTGRGRVLIFDSTGVKKGELGRSSPAAPGLERLAEPAGVAVGRDGTVYVSDAPKQVIRQYDRVGKQVAAWGFGLVDALSGPRLGVFADGSVVATLPGSSMLIRFDVSGRLLGSSGQPGKTDYLDMPSGLAVDTSGKLYVTDLKQGLVRVYEP